MTETKKAEQFFPVNGNGHSYATSSMMPLVNQTTTDEEESLDLRQLWTVARHRMPLIATVALGFTTAVGLWTLFQQPIYKGKFQVLVESPTSNQSQSTELAVLGSSVSGVDYPTQIEVLRSPEILQTIIEQINSKYPQIDYKDLINKTKSPLKINQVEETKILEISYEDGDAEKIKFILEKLSQGYLKYSSDERQADIKQGIEFVRNQLPSLQKRVNTLQERLEKFRQKHNLINPDDLSIRFSQQLLALQTQDFDTQVTLQQTTALYATLQQQLGLQPEEAMAASYLSESPRYQNLLLQLQGTEIQLAKESVRFVKNSPPLEAIQEQRDSLLSLLRQEANSVLGKKLANNLVSMPGMISPSTLRLQLSQQFIEATNQVKVLQVRRRALEQAINGLNQQMKLLPVIARQFTDIQRELTIATDSLTRFLAASENLELDAAQKSQPWRIIAAPQLAETPIFPKPIQFLCLGAIGGVLLGLGAAFVAEKLDPVFHSSDELKDSTRLPILSLIPLEKNIDSLEEVQTNFPEIQIGEMTLTVDSEEASDKQEIGYKASPFLEAFRSLYTNIRLLGLDNSNNSIVISSSTPAEGKSTVSLNLAKAAAAMGQRVLLIDADLRRPQVHIRLNLPNKLGLSNVIATGTPLQEAIQKVPQWDNLFVLSAGNIPPDPTRLLSSKKMQEVMRELRDQSNFDLVIYDTPPLLGFADARILAPTTIGAVLVVKIGKTDRSALKQSIDQLKMSKVPILGVVANNVTRHSHGSYYYHDDYSRYYSRK